MAKRYKVEVSEILTQIVEIEADSEAEAVELVEKQYSNGDIVLDASNFLDNEIKIYND